EAHAALPETVAPSPAALVWKGRALLPAGQDGVSITIFDQEPTSIIAYALASGAYKQYVQEAISSINQGDGEAGEAHVKAKAALPEELFSTSVLYSESPLHCQFTVQDGSSDAPATLQVTAYYAPQFHEFRKEFLDGGDAAFVASLSRCMQWESKGGKSNVYFAKTRDDRLIVKQLSKAEKQSILEFIPAYFKYLGTAREAGQESCLARILGVYQVHITWQGKEHGGGSVSSGKDVVMELLIMENFFYGRSIQRVYDLKGSERDRYVVENPKAIGAVLLDENLKEMNLSSPTVVGPYAFGRLQRAVWSDTGFLSNVGVMDYSLLVGVDKTKHELVIGIIDFIRQVQDG
ncbi:phosphatidylinositol-4-phosphate 5-kinase, partial [Helicosporidium sp. ATCC 50920]